MRLPPTGAASGDARHRRPAMPPPVTRPDRRTSARPPPLDRREPGHHAAAAPAAASPTATPTAGGSATARRSPGSGRSPSRRPGPTSGSAPTRTATSRRPAATREGRKQYRYHPRYRARREAAKFERLVAFARALPAIRAPRRPGPGPARPAPREGPRGGRPAARADADPGRQRRVRAAEPLVRPDDAARPPRDGSRLVDPLPVPRQVGRDATRSGCATDASRAVVRRCRDLPGQELFQYVDEDGEPSTSRRDDVNDYLRAIVAGRHREGLPDVGRDGARVPRAAGARRAGDRRPRRSGTSSRRSATRPTGSATRRPSAAPSYVHPVVVEAYLDARFGARCSGRPRRPAPRPARSRRRRSGRSSASSSVAWPGTRRGAARPGLRACVSRPRRRRRPAARTPARPRRRSAAAPRHGRPSSRRGGA